MPKILVRTLDRARVDDAPRGAAGAAETRALIDGERDPIHLHIHTVADGGELRIGPGPVDCIGYVWEGAVRVGDELLAQGSSLIVEHGASATVRGTASRSRLVTFRAACSGSMRAAGGRVHLLPDAQVPRLADLGGSRGTGGGMHADAGGTPATLWLHENSFPPPGPTAARAADAGIHSHSEDEVIFVTAGAMRLGSRLYGPGTAVAIAADTFYGFVAGPDGLDFINFRAAKPNLIRFRNGGSLDEVAFWKSRLDPPRYITVEPAQV